MNLNLDLGHTLSGRPVIAHGLDNPHISIDGRSGSGKSFFLKKLILQAVRQGAACVVFDYSSDFSNFVPPGDISFSAKYVGKADFTLNPLINIGHQSSAYRAQQLLMLLEQVFPMGPRAKLALRQAAQEYLDQESAIPTLEHLIRYIKHHCALTTGLYAGLDRLELLRSFLSCGEFPIDLDLMSPGLTVLNFSALPSRSMQHFLIEMILTIIWSVCTQSASHEYPPLVLVLDEAQNLSWGQDSMAVRILREGRKFDIAGWFSTQWMDKPDTVAALQQAALQAHFRPDCRGVNRVLNTLDLVSEERGACRQLLHKLRVEQFLRQMEDGRVIVVYVTA